MLFEECCSVIENTGFNRLRQYADNVNVYCTYRDERMNIVFVWNEAALAGFSPEFIDDQNRSVVAFFTQKGVFNCRLLNIICTYNTGMSKRNTEAHFPVWFIDENTGKLIIYEEQPDDFAGLREVIENIDISAAARRGKKSRRRAKIVPTYMNWFLIAVNIIVFAIMEIRGSTTDTVYMLKSGALNVSLVLDRGEYYRLFTSMFMHGGFSHIFNNMLVLFCIGDNLERAVGHVKYLIMYIAGGLLANIAALIYYDVMNMNVCCVGASGAIFAVVGALFYIVIINKGRLEDLSVYKLGLFIVMSIYLGFQSTTTSNSAHIGGLAAGFILAMLIYRKGKGTRL